MRGKHVLNSSFSWVNSRLKRVEVVYFLREKTIFQWIKRFLSKIWTTFFEEIWLLGSIPDSHQRLWGSRPCQQLQQYPAPNNNKIYCNGSCTFNRFLIVQAGYDRCSCAQMIIEGEGSVAAAIGAWIERVLETMLWWIYDLCNHTGTQPVVYRGTGVVLEKYKYILSANLGFPFTVYVLYVWSGPLLSREWLPR